MVSPLIVLGKYVLCNIKPIHNLRCLQNVVFEKCQCGYEYKTIEGWNQNPNMESYTPISVICDWKVGARLVNAAADHLF